MKQVRQWILIDPLDTLFFKGSEPMIAGESHEVRSVFPPMPSTLLGALCTAILQQRGIDPKAFVSKTGPDPSIVRDYPFLGNPGSSGFHVTGPLFHVRPAGGRGEWLFPSPAHWFGALPEHLQDGQEVQVAVAEELPDRLRPPGLCGSVSSPLWVLQPEQSDTKSLGGYWTNMAALVALKQGKHSVKVLHSTGSKISDKPALVSLETLYGNEVRVGIALETGTRRVRPGHLYSATQVRLRAGVNLAVGLSEELIPSHLDAAGILQLGGEQRLVSYQLLSNGPPVADGSSPWILSLSAFPAEKLYLHKWETLPRVSGHLIRMGGWDMKERFHKPMKAYFPAGAVIKVGQDIVLPFGFMRL